MYFENAFVFLFSNFIFDGGQFLAKMSNLECGRLCMKTVGCSSFFYSEILESCSVSRNMYRNTTSLTPQTGYDYYTMQTELGMKCDSAADCSYQNSVCYKGRCECEVGTSYLPHNMSCVTECTEYGAAFHRYEEYGILGFNTKTIYVGMAEICEQACLDETSFECINEEYNLESHRCNLSNMTWAQVPSFYRETDAEDWTLYYRQCA